jgi:hypothetical protein
MGRDGGKEGFEMKQPRLHVLLDGGDWACSWAYQGGLALVCHELATLVDADQAACARAIETRAGDDMAAASKEWRVLAKELRGGPPAVSSRAEASSAAAAISPA